MLAAIANRPIAGRATLPTPRILAHVANHTGPNVSQAAETAIRTCNMVIDAHLLSDDELSCAIKELRQAGAVLLNSPEN